MSDLFVTLTNLTGEDADQAGKTVDVPAGSECKYLGTTMGPDLREGWWLLRVYRTDTYVVAQPQDVAVCEGVG